MIPPRTRTAAVQAVLQKNWDGTTDLTPFIQWASAIVDRVGTGSIAKGYALSSVELELVERYLAAHAYARVDKTMQNKSTSGGGGSASATFTGQTGMSLDATEYGQMAVNADFSGTLAAIGKRAFASLTWVGKPPSKQIPYEQRD